MAIVRRIHNQVTFAGWTLTNAPGVGAICSTIAARGEVTADTGWPICSVFVTAKPANGNEEDELTVEAGAGTNNVLRFTGRVRRFRSSAFPRSIEMVATGTLAYAAEWAPAEDILFEDEFPEGVTDDELVPWVLEHVPGVSYDTSGVQGTGVTLGLEAPEAFDWQAGVTAWSYIQALDRATLYRTYQTRDGAVHRVRMIGHPDNSIDFMLTDGDILDGATGSRDTERTRNFVRVLGYDYGRGEGPVQAELAAENDFQGPGDDPATRHVEEFRSSLIESGVDPDTGDWDENPGLRADEIAAQILPDVNKEFVEASVPSWRDEVHGPGMTILLDALTRLAIGEPMWVVRYAWEVGDDGWRVTYGMIGGGLPQDNPNPPV